MSLYGLALCRAASIIDGQPQLSYFLGVAPSKLSLWSSGADGVPPLTIFLRAVDIVLADSLRIDNPTAQDEP
jgi:DNA-binding transcriptional regulator YdaS (Cro superfamily)